MKSKNKVDLSVVVVSYNTKDITLDCLKSVLSNTKDINYEIVIVDNASSDGSVEAIKKLAKKNKSVRVLANKKNLGFSGGNNVGIEKTKGEYILLLNSDTIVHDNVLGEMVHWMEKNEDVGFASCALKNEDGSEQGTGGYFPTLPRVFTWMTIQDLPLVDSIVKPFHPMKPKNYSSADSFYDEERELDWVTGAFMMIRSKVFDDVEVFDEKYFMYTEEVDLCYRAKQKGWKVLYNPKWAITHLGGASGTHENSVINEYHGIKRFYKKFYPKWQYVALRLFLKLGAFLRVIAFRVVEGKESSNVYKKAFLVA